jgi:hypothetical protein
MTLRVDVFFFDRLAPFPDDVEEVGFERRGAAVDVGELATCAKLEKETVRLVEALQRVLVAAVPAIEFGKLPRCFALKDQILSLDPDLLGA